MLLGLLLACNGTVEEKHAEVPQSPIGLARFYDLLRDDAAIFGYDQGQWTEDYGDAAAFGAYYYSHAGQHQNNEEYIRIAMETKEYNLEVNQDLPWIIRVSKVVIMNDFQKENNCTIVLSVTVKKCDLGSKVNGCLQRLWTF